MFLLFVLLCLSLLDKLLYVLYFETIAAATEGSTTPFEFRLLTQPPSHNYDGFISNEWKELLQQVFLSHVLFTVNVLAKCQRADDDDQLSNYNWLCERISSAYMAKFCYFCSV